MMTTTDSGNISVADVLSETITVANDKEARAARIAKLRDTQLRGRTLNDVLGGTEFDNAILADSVKLAIDAGDLVIDSEVHPFTADTPILVDDDSGRELWAVYMTRGEHNIRLMLPADKGRTQIVEFVNNVLFVHTKELRDRIEAELKEETSSYALAIVRCTVDQAKHLVALQKQAQRSVTTAGALSTPFIRAAEGTLSAALAAAKGAIIAGNDHGGRSFGV